jgi:hypothetical protein
MKSILLAARQQGFEVTKYSDLRLEARRGDYSLQFRRSVHTPLCHLKVGRESGETLICQAFCNEDQEEQIAARILSLPLSATPREQ